MLLGAALLVNLFLENYSRRRVWPKQLVAVERLLLVQVQVLPVKVAEAVHLLLLLLVCVDVVEQFELWRRRKWRHVVVGVLGKCRIERKQRQSCWVKFDEVSLLLLLLLESNRWPQLLPIEEAAGVQSSVLTQVAGAAAAKVLRRTRLDHSRDSRVVVLLRRRRK